MVGKLGAWGKRLQKLTICLKIMHNMLRISTTLNFVSYYAQNTFTTFPGGACTCPLAHACGRPTDHGSDGHCNVGLELCKNAIQGTDASVRVWNAARSGYKMLLLTRSLLEYFKECG